MEAQSISINRLEKEIQEEVTRRTYEILIRVLSAAEFDAEQPYPEMLTKYVSLKILRHKIKKKLRDGLFFGNVTEEMLEEKFVELTDRIKTARRKYYESKRRYEAR